MSFRRQWSTVPFDRLDKIDDGELEVISDGSVCSLILRVENGIYEFKSKKIAEVVPPSSITGDYVDIDIDDSPYTIPINHTHLTIRVDCTRGSVDLLLPSVIDLDQTSYDIKRISNSILKKLKVIASTTKNTDGSIQDIDGSAFIKIGRKNLSARIISHSTGWSIV